MSAWDAASAQDLLVVQLGPFLAALWLRQRARCTRERGRDADREISQATVLGLLCQSSQAFY
eukprot:21555-Rhodomonas_salina.4